MHANPSTAQPCAPTNREDKDSQMVEFISLYTHASPALKAKARMVLEANEYGQPQLLKTVIDDPETAEDARPLLSAWLKDLEEELANAAFKPLFTREQVLTFEANQQKERDSRRKMALFVLCLSEKRMQLLAKNNHTAFKQTLVQVMAFVDDSKAQLELAETALNRLVLVSGNYEGGEV